MCVIRSVNRPRLGRTSRPLAGTRPFYTGSGPLSTISSPLSLLEMSTKGREYDIVLFGASGYTGKYTAEQLARLAPTNLRWAVAGRSTTKLEAVVNEIRSADRAAPSIEICSLEAEDLDALAKKTIILINAVGPYILYGEPVICACAENGTHYIDVRGSFRALTARK